ncbi:Acetyltransferase (GNAT) domain-containing protein [Flexibacter flexilis DSM 6793]|uniref:Acetyltransferase (GNAT) domain-containing protein n=1 Tax=Flexibacter flexilis DSM 6793 TaxID=927664 RepID=A0A1I1HD38_9BACT|nr:GNAT family N-acetyltransferase [Flexibacter flexilis]SFC19403.1 Acetyltransferase (GNAT) domain-containing protein [Flexibacter flexilis DSM 6793]
MEINTLENISLPELTQAFNLAFSDYLIPMHLTEPVLAAKIHAENIDLSWSVGAFDGGQLVGFVLHGTNKTAVYNAGTGVVPSHRKQQITRQLYDFILPKLKANHFESVQLEVIEANEKAIRAYQKIGFETVRVLQSYKGMIQPKYQPIAWQLQRLDALDWPLAQTFWDWPPTWQNSIQTIGNQQENIQIWALCTPEGSLISYLIYNQQSNRIQQFATHPAHRHKGAATYLFSHLAKQINKQTAMINADKADRTTDQFLSGIGLKRFIAQYEMMLSL